MTSESLNQLVQRLAAIERELETVRAKNRALQNRAERSIRLRLISLLLGIVCLGLVLTSFHIPTQTQAQGKGGPQVLTVRAPFHVVDDQGKLIMKVVAADGKSLRGVFVFNDQGLLAVQASVDKKGAGGLLARNHNIGGGGGAGIIYDEASNEPFIGGRGPDNKIRFEMGPKGYAVHNASGISVANLGAASDGTGRLTLGNSGGSTVFEAGTYPDGKGFARAYPIGGKMPLPVPWYIMGQTK